MLEILKNETRDQYSSIGLLLRFNKINDAISTTVMSSALRIHFKFFLDNFCQLLTEFNSKTYKLNMKSKHNSTMLKLLRLVE